MSDETIPKTTPRPAENTSIWVSKENHNALKEHYGKQGVKLTFALNQIIKQHLATLKN